MMLERNRGRDFDTEEGIMGSRFTVNCSLFMMKGFQTSDELMEAVKALDYKAQYKVCEAFYKLSKGFDWSDRLMFQRFEGSFTMIDAENLE